MNLLQRCLNRTIEAQLRRPWLFVAIAAALVVLSVVYAATSMTFLTSQRALISQENRLVRLAEEADQFSDYDTFVVAIKSADDEHSIQFARALSQRLEADRTDFKEVFWRIDPAAFKPWALLYMSEKDLYALRERIQEHMAFIRAITASPTLEGLLYQLNNEMAEGMVGSLFTGFLREGEPAPFDLQFLVQLLRGMRSTLQGGTRFTSPWNSFIGGASPADQLQDGYFRTDDKQYLLLFVTPGDAREGFTRWEVALANLRSIIADVKKNFPGTDVGVTGQKALGEDEMTGALHDMSLATALSLGGVAILLILFWRGLRKPVMEIAALVAGLCLTCGLTTLLIGHLNLLSVVFAPLLLGLGIDYGVHWFARYREERLKTTIPDALRTTMKMLGPAILLAGTTASLSFFPFALTGFKGLAELGIICTVGLLVITLSTLCLLPALITLFDGRTAEKAHGDLSKPFLDLPHRGALLLVGVFVVVALFSVWGAGHVRFDLNTLELQSKTAESVVWERRLMASSQRSSLYGIILAYSLDEVERKTRALRTLPSVSEVQSVIDLLPKDQERKISIVGTMRPLLSDIGHLAAVNQPVDVKQVDDILGRIRFKMLESAEGASTKLQSDMRESATLIDEVRTAMRHMKEPQLERRLRLFQSQLYNDLRDKLDLLRKGVRAKPMRVEDLPKQVRERYVGWGNIYAIKVFPSKNIWEPELLKAFVHDLQGVDPDAVGDPVTLSVFTEAFRNAIIKAAGYGVVLILLLILVSLRSPILALLAFSPLVMAAAVTFGIMHLLRIDLNLANSIFLPLMLSAGVEYGIIIVQRWRQRMREALHGVIPVSTGVGVILAELSTTVGFGSLTVSKHQGIQSLGLLSMIASLSVLAAAVLFLPALLQLLSSRREEARRARSDVYGTKTKKRT